MSFTDLLSQPDPQISEAVKAFTTSIATSASNLEATEQSLWKQWRELFRVVASTPHSSQTHLVDFIQELRKQPNPDERVEIWGDGFKWENLPILGPAVREVWDTTGACLVSYIYIYIFSSQLECVNGGYCD